MPVEVFDKEVFKKYASIAVKCIVYKDTKRGVAKVKARTKRKLVTIKVPLSELEAFLNEVKCPEVVDISRG